MQEVKVRGPILKKYYENNNYNKEFLTNNDYHKPSLLSTPRKSGNQEPGMVMYSCWIVLLEFVVLMCCMRHITC